MHLNFSIWAGGFILVFVVCWCIRVLVIVLAIVLVIVLAITVCLVMSLIVSYWHTRLSHTQMPLCIRRNNHPGDCWCGDNSTRGASPCLLRYGPWRLPERVHRVRDGGHDRVRGRQLLHQGAAAGGRGGHLGRRGRGETARFLCEGLPLFRTGTPDTCNNNRKSNCLLRIENFVSWVEWKYRTIVLYFEQLQCLQKFLKQNNNCLGRV